MTISVAGVVGAIRADTATAPEAQTRRVGTRRSRRLGSVHSRLVAAPRLAVRDPSAAVARNSAAHDRQRARSTGLVV